MKQFTTIFTLIVSMMVGQVIGAGSTVTNPGQVAQMPAVQQPVIQPDQGEAPKLMSPQEMNQLREQFLELLAQNTQKQIIEQSQTATPQEKILTLAYVLYRKFTTLYKIDTKDASISIGGVGFTLIDYVIRLAATINHAVTFQKDRYLPVATMLMLQSQIEGNGRSAQLLSSIVNKVIFDFSEMLTNPDYYDTRVPLPGKVLLEAAPAALYHAGKVGAHMVGLAKEMPTYTVYTHTDKNAGLEIQNKTDAGYELKSKTVGDIFAYHVVNAEKKSDELKHYVGYKAGVATAVQSVIKSGTSIFETVLTDNIDKDTVQKVEDRTLGVIKPKMISTLAKEFFAPYILLKMAESAKGSSVESLVPEYSKIDLGMQEAQKLQFKKGDESLEVLVAGEELDPTQFARKKVIEYVYKSMGAHILMKGINYFVHNHEDNVYNGLAYLADIFVKTGICSKNPVEQLSDKVKEVRRNYWMARPEFLTEMLGLATAFSMQKDTVFSEDDRKVLPGLLQELSQVFSAMNKMSRMKPDAKRYKEFAHKVEEKLSGVIAVADTNNLISKVCKQVIKELVLTKDSLGEKIMSEYGAAKGKDLGQKLTEKLGIA